MTTITGDARRAFMECAARAGERIARRWFALRGNHNETHITEGQLACISAGAAQLVTLRLCEALWDALARCPEAVPAVSTEALRAVLSWNDRNGDYEDLTRADLIGALRTQIEYARS